MQSLLETLENKQYNYWTPLCSIMTTFELESRFIAFEMIENALSTRKPIANCINNLYIDAAYKIVIFRKLSNARDVIIILSAMLQRSSLAVPVVELPPHIHMHHHASSHDYDGN